VWKNNDYHLKVFIKDKARALNVYPYMGQSTPKRGELGLGARKSVEEPRRLHCTTSRCFQIVNQVSDYLSHEQKGYNRKRLDIFCPRPMEAYGRIINRRWLDNNYLEYD
jgi:hypothetical protein